MSLNIKQETNLLLTQLNEAVEAYKESNFEKVLAKADENVKTLSERRSNYLSRRKGLTVLVRNFVKTLNETDTMPSKEASVELVEAFKREFDFLAELSKLSE
jgi:hypothetical protein